MTNTNIICTQLEQKLDYNTNEYVTIDKVINILNNANEADYFKYMGKKENHINDFIWDPKECLICKCKFNNIIIYFFHSCCGNCSYTVFLFFIFGYKRPKIMFTY